jgi:cellulose synthase/poly-beta-1,6-N-acetylglucosamine synthase-like glycosyltransferase
MLEWFTSLLLLASAWFFLLYFSSLFVLYFLINMTSSFVLLWKTLQEQRKYNVTRQKKSFLETTDNPESNNTEILERISPPISLLVPAYNEAITITASVYSLLNLVYEEYEVIVVNDGSKDTTLEILLHEFEAVPANDLPLNILMTQTIRGVYRSQLFPNLRIVDKYNGGKADALNAGINFAHYDYFCCIDADSILHPLSLQKLIQPFVEDATTIACGGTVHVINGCEVRDGMITKVGIARNWLAMFQIVEYMRTLLFGRLSWASFNSLLIISGAFGMFRKDKVIAAGGYLHGTIGEDMELVVRLHRIMMQRKEKYRIVFVPEPLCWTEVPEDLRTLKSQRVRWQRGLCESIAANRELLFRIRGGSTAWVSLPFMLLFELIGPLVEALGYIFIAFLMLNGVVSPFFAFVLFLVPVCLGTIITLNSILVQEILYQIYRNPRYIALMLGLAIVENFGYRQLNMYWRIIGLWKWFRGRASVWGDMKRSAAWDKNVKHAETPLSSVPVPDNSEQTSSAPQHFNPHLDLHFDVHFDTPRLSGRVLG